MRTGFPVIKTGMSLQCRKGSNSRISRIAQMNMNLLVIWSILSRELSKEDMELKLEIQGNFLLQSAVREGRISFRDLIGAIRIRVPYCTMAELVKPCPKNIIPFLDWFKLQVSNLKDQKLKNEIFRHISGLRLGAKFEI